MILRPFFCYRSGMSFERFEELRSDLDNLFQHSRLRNQEFQGFPDKDSSITFCVTKDLLQDTHEALMAIFESESDQRAPAAYVLFWGILQTVAIQQDALSEMYLSIYGQEPRNFWNNSRWSKVRQIRRQLAGHPAKADRKDLRTRCSIARGFLSPTSAYVEKWNIDNAECNHELIALKPIIQAYYQVAVQMLSSIHEKMYEHWGPIDKESYSNIPVIILKLTDNWQSDVSDEPE